MIEFSGEISNVIRKKVLKKRDRQLGFIFLGATLITIAVAVILALSRDTQYAEFSICAVILSLITIYFLIAPTPKQVYRFRWDYKIQINSEEIIVTNSQFNQENIKSISKIKKVIDDRDCYYLIYADISNAFICEKNLLRQGTLEEFEKLFEGKIIRAKHT